MLPLKGVSFKKGLIINKMTILDKLISLGVVGGFLFFIGAKVYDHEKEHLDPIIKKIKGWFVKDDEEQFPNSNEEFELGFHGQMR